VTSLKPRFLESPPAGFRVRARLRKTYPARRYHGFRWRRDADVVVLSFPKAGRTWLRMMLGRALSEHFGAPDVDLLNIHRMGDPELGIPRILVKHDENPHLKVPAELVTDKSEYRGLRVVYLVRDLRDLAVSNHFEFTHRRGQTDLGISAYLRSRRGSIDTMLRHYNIWAANRHVPAAFHLVRYEDLHQDPEGCLRVLLAFAGVNGVSRETLRDSVEFASFSNMRRMETEDALGHRWLRAVDPDDLNSYKTRRGKVGGYVDFLSRADIEFVERRMREELDPFFGYC